MLHVCTQSLELKVDIYTLSNLGFFHASIQCRISTTTPSVVFYSRSFDSISMHFTSTKMRSVFSLILYWGYLLLDVLTRLLGDRLELRQ